MEQLTYEHQMKAKEIERIIQIAEDKIKRIYPTYSLVLICGRSSIDPAGLVQHLYECLKLPRNDRSRSTEYIIPRYAIMRHLVRDKGITLKNTGLIFGLDHSTVVNALTVFEGMMSVNDLGTRDLYENILNCSAEFEKIKPCSH